MQGSVRRREWACSRVWARLATRVLAAGAVALGGCSNEAEITTELPGSAAGDVGDSMGSNTPSGGASEPAGSSDEVRTAPPGPSGSALDPGTAEGGVGADPLSLAAQDVPSGDYCAPVSDWDPAWLQFEREVLLLVNERRAKAADCGEEGQFGPAGPLVMDPILRCSARLQSLDMFERHFFDHTNPDGLDPFERMSAAGFHGSGAGENIAVGQTSPQQVMQSWMDSDGHCANVMRPNYTMLGVGYHPGAGSRGLGSHFWTQNFGAPPSVRSCRTNCR
jgi:uncharacterized protein YkwD